jgi:replicative DNA helicase
METELESLILKSLISNDQFTRKVIPFLKKEYFEGRHHSVFNHIIEFVNKYNKLPTVDALSVELQSSEITDGQYEESANALSELKSVDEKVDEQWLLDSTEKWCQDRSIHLAIMESISVIDGKHPTISKSGLPDLLQDALAVTFDTNVGHAYLESAEDRFDYYHKKERRLPFDLEMLNRITRNGLPPKTLNCIMASSGGGKSLMMTHIAAAAMMAGKSVLYITMEMAEEEIAKRVDANMLNVSLDDMDALTKDKFTGRVKRLTEKTQGELIIKEYPTGSAHVGHFRALVNELKLKKKFVPDLIVVDYINICTSSRLKGIGGAVNSYTLIKSIAEEMRGFAVESNVPIITATQTNRDGFGNTDVDMNNVSESFGLPATCDLLLAIIVTDELNELNQIMIKQLKNRYGDLNKYTRFMLGIDRSKMRLYDVEDSAHEDLSNTKVTSVATTSPFGKKSTGGFADFKV